MKEFETAKMDSTTQIYTAIFTVIILGSIVLLFTRLETDGAVILIPMLILAVALISSYLMIPKISVNNDVIKIKNTFTDFQIPIISIQSIEHFPKIGFNLRTFGVGGVFGYFGFFNGNDVWYVTNIKKKVKIVMNTGKVYMISPENVEDFISFIDKNRNKNLDKI